MGVFSRISTDRRCEIGGVAILALTVLLFIALATDRYQGETARSLTDLGDGGSWIAGVLYLLIGRAAHLIYVLTGAWGIMLLRHQPLDRLWTRFLGAFVLLVASAGFIEAAFRGAAQPGGMVGGFIVHLFHDMFGTGGTIVISLTFAIIGMLLSTEFLFVRLLHGSWRTLHLMIRSIEEMRREASASMSARRDSKGKRAKVIDLPADDDEVRISMWREFFAFFSTKKSKVRNAVKKVRKAHAGDAPEKTVAAKEVTIHLSDDADDFDDEEIESTPAAPAKQLEFEEDADAPMYVSTRADSDVPRVPDKKTVRRRAYADELPPDYTYPKRYAKPPLTLFDEPERRPRADVTESLQETAQQLEETLQTFGIEAEVTDIVRGPTITRFELEPASGIKVSRFVSLADDIALALKAHGVRVEAPIPGKGRVGIEIPNESSEPVAIRQLLESSSFKSDAGRLPIAMGKDIAGEAITADLCSMPHLLVAGATGSGKTVFVKTVLASMLASKTPDELQLILVDPKMVELSIFNDIPHLVTPVVIDPKKAATALSWLIHEMEQRYELFTHLRVRNIEVYNESVENGEIEVETEDGEEGEQVESIRKLPYIVCVIDELADLMMLARAEVEDAIFRLAQLARAVGIHLIIATQRPSVDVLTGVIKANLPARVSFQVSSRIDSRCILEVMGAERLLGKGDMLYLPPGRGKPMRLQSGFVSDNEMHDLIAYLKTQAPPQYRDEIANYGKQGGAAVELDDEEDELFDDAVRVVVETGQASISMIQRRLRVGYTRAARLIDMMELRGIVGPHLGSKAREILVPVGGDHDEVA
jgi:S-DNA-T family DNA segregation ATPase FtsK/SpoIIIE